VTEHAGTASPFADRHVLIIAAHPGDEVLGAGGQFHSFDHLSLLHVTDGVGPNHEASAKGFASLRAYAAARAREVRGAVAMAGVPATFHALGVRCREACFHLPAIIRHLERAIVGIGPDIILTHAYEGGHPDHDAVALAVHQAASHLPFAPPVWEFTGSHRSGGGTVCGMFLPIGDPPLRLELPEAEHVLKRQMLDRFHSQLDAMAQFPLDAELFRPAPAYDFANPPDQRPLGYELEAWGMPAPLWLTAAREAMKNERSWRLIVRLRWEMWARQFQPDRPGIARLMRAMPLLGRRVW
jgi:LmbE family N-acetylglucosaminyl deacetylase